MMIGRDRQILAQMGIDVWIPQHTHVQKQSARLLWRDQVVEKTFAPQIKAPEVPVVQTKTPVTSIEVAIKPQPVQIEAHSVEPAQVMPVLPAAQFSWWCVRYQNALILTNSQGLSEKALTLWQNIQHFTQFSQLHVQWPLALEHLQEMRGFQSYIEGFIDGLSEQPLKLLCLGDAVGFDSLVQLRQAEVLPSLDEMCELPELKKRLWDAMRGTDETLRV